VEYGLCTLALYSLMARAESLNRPVTGVAMNLIIYVNSIMLNKLTKRCPVEHSTLVLFLDADCALFGINMRRRCIRILVST